MNRPKYGLCCLVPYKSIAEVNTNGITAENGQITLFEDGYIDCKYVGRILAERQGKGKYKVYLITNTFAESLQLDAAGKFVWILNADNIPVTALRIGETITVKAA